jgi:hypothetical protein
MHSNYCMPYTFHRIQKRIEEARKFIGNYIYYRRHNHSHFNAWSMAKNTL